MFCSHAKRLEIVWGCAFVLFLFISLVTYQKPKPHVVPQPKQQQSSLKFKVTKLREGKYWWEAGLKFNHTCRLGSLVHKKEFPCCLSERVKHFQQKHLVSELGDLSLTQVTNTFFQKISGKRVLFIGDSILRQFAASLWDILEPRLNRIPQLVMLSEDPTNPKSLKMTPTENTSVPKSLNISLFGLMEIHMPEKDFTFQFVTFCRIHNSGCNSPHPCLWSLNHLNSFVQKSDVVLFNMGLHFEKCTKESFAKTLTKVAELFQMEVSKHPDKQVILRSTLPQHFPTKNGYYDVMHRNRQPGCAQKSTVEEHWSNEFLKNTKQQFGFKYLDSFPIYKERWDLHWKPIDCSHSCHTAETTVPELALLNNLLN